MNDYEKYLESQVISSALKERLKPDDIVFIQNQQNFYKAQIIKLSEKSAKVKILDGIFQYEVKNFPYVKIAKLGDKVAVVWEAWRGSQARGGYRWERVAYENLRLLCVENLPPKTVICEESFLVVGKLYEKAYLDKITPHLKIKKIGLN